jgi:hypothetical protein
VPTKVGRHCIKHAQQIAVWCCHRIAMAVNHTPIGNNAVKFVPGISSLLDSL